MSLDTELTAYVRARRQEILAMAHAAGGGHIAPAYSIIELVSLLYREVLTHDSKRPAWVDRDRFILSKGHGCLALYSVLAAEGYFARHELKNFCRPGGILGGHPDMHKVPGIEASTGSLGHGFVFAVGVAIGLKKLEAKSRVVTLLGDGEAQEGSIWEAALLASAQKLSNLTAIVDYNKLQGMGRVSEVNDLEPFADKWRAFGFDVDEIDGHDLGAARSVLTKTEARSLGRPQVIIAHTTKGKGLSFMENKVVWHYKLPKGDQMIAACKELGVNGDISGVLS